MSLKSSRLIVHLVTDSIKNTFFINFFFFFFLLFFAANFELFIPFKIW